MTYTLMRNSLDRGNLKTIETRRKQNKGTNIFEREGIGFNT